MIEINLVPPQLRKIKKSRTLSNEGIKVPRGTLLVMGGGLIGFLIFLNLIFLICIFLKMKQNNRLISQYEKLKPEGDKYESIRAEMQILSEQLKFVESVWDENKISWANKLNIISDHVPRELWLTKVAMEGKNIFIEGSAVSHDKSEMFQVHAFISSLKEDMVFMQQFEDLELGKIQRSKTSDVDVVRFSITAKIK